LSQLFKTPVVSEVLSSPQQIKTSAILSGTELVKESPPLPPGIINQDVLVRYTVTPVIDPVTKIVIGALVSGDVANGKLPIVEQTLKAFGGGYSAIYLRKSPKEFALATALDKFKGRLKPSVELLNTSLLNAAENARGVPVAERMDVGGQTYTTAAKAIIDVNGEPIAILVRGTPETELNALLKNSLSLQLLLAALGLGIIWLLAKILSQAIAEPVQQLQRTTQAFSQGIAKQEQRFLPTMKLVNWLSLLIKWLTVLTLTLKQFNAKRSYVFKSKRKLPANRLRMQNSKN